MSGPRRRSLLTKIVFGDMLRVCGRFGRLTLGEGELCVYTYSSEWYYASRL